MSLSVCAEIRGVNSLSPCRFWGLKFRLSGLAVSDFHSESSYQPHGSRFLKDLGSRGEEGACDRRELMGDKAESPLSTGRTRLRIPHFLGTRADADSEAVYMPNLFIFRDRVSQCFPSCPGTCSAHQTGLEQRSTCFCLVLQA